MQMIFSGDKIGGSQLIASSPCSGARRAASSVSFVNAPAAILSVTQRQMEAQGLDRETCMLAYGHMRDLAAAYEARDLDAAKSAILRHDQLSVEVAVRFMDTQGGSI